MQIRLIRLSCLMVLLLTGCFSTFAQLPDGGSPLGHWNMGACGNNPSLVRVYEVQKLSNTGLQVLTSCYRVVNGQFMPTNEPVSSFVLTGCTNLRGIQCSVPGSRTVMRDAGMSMSECRNRMGTSGIPPQDRGYSDMGCPFMTKHVSERITWANTWVLSVYGDTIDVEISINDPQHREHVSRRGKRIVPTR